MTMPTANEMTPEHAIRNAIHALSKERYLNARKQSPDRDEVDGRIGDEIEALDFALLQLKEYAALKAALRTTLG